MLKARIRQYLAPMVWVEHSPRQGFQDLDTNKRVKVLQSSGLADLQTKRAFTLAEVLITLGIIGVVAAMTIPTLVADYQERSFDTAATVFERKLGESLKVMNSQQSLAGFSSTEDFVEELSKHFKINKVCQNDELMECFEEEIFWGSGDVTPEAVDMTKIKTSKNFGQKDWQQTNVVGVQFASGVTALVAYNANASQDPYSNQIIKFSGSSNGRRGSVNLGTDALAILYDTNGFKSPNQSSKDLRTINVSKLGSGCFAEVNGVCLTMPIQQAPAHVWNACQPGLVSTDPDDLKFMTDYKINTCLTGNDYWAGAAELCGGTDKMATMEQLAKIASYIYNTDSVPTTGTTMFLPYDETKAAELGVPDAPHGFFVWAGEEDGTYAYYRDIGETDIGGYSTPRWHSNFTACVE